MSPAEVWTTAKDSSNAQNVHNVAVSASIVDTSARVCAAAGHEFRSVVAVACATEEVTDAVLTSAAGAEVKRDALRFLEDVAAPGLPPHSRPGVNAAELLSVVWSVVKRYAPVGSAARANMGEVLASQLASGVECDLPVCYTGKMARVVGALDGEVALLEAAGVPGVRSTRPAWALREELAALAARVRDGTDAEGDGDGDGRAARLCALARREYGDSGGGGGEDGDGVGGGGGGAAAAAGIPEEVMGPMLEELSRGFQ